MNSFFSFLWTFPVTLCTKLHGTLNFFFPLEVKVAHIKWADYKKKKKKGPPFVNGKLTVTAILCPSNFNDDFILSKPPPPPGEGGEGFSRWKLLHTFNFEKSKTRNLLLPYYLWEERERERESHWIKRKGSKIKCGWDLRLDFWSA